jgi:O-antigen/teichoic acid export membrane protein
MEVVQMRHKWLYLTSLIIAFLVFATGLLMCIVPSWKLFYVGLGLVAVGTLIVFSTALLKIITSRRRFKFGWKFIIKVFVTILSVFMFMFGLGIIIAAIGLLTLLYIIPMFVAFVRANPFEHVIITPNYDDVDTEFFRNPSNNE